MEGGGSRGETERSRKGEWRVRGGRRIRPMTTVNDPCSIRTIIQVAELGEVRPFAGRMWVGRSWCITGEPESRFDRWNEWWG